MWQSYVDEQMVSDGAKVRVWMNLVPSLLMLVYWKRWKRYFPNYGSWLIIAIGSIASVLLVDFATTAVDRVALYFTPIQVAVLSRLPILTRRRIPSRYMAFGVVLGYAAVLFVWLNYASHAEYWVPYQNSLLS
ncbi:MAG: EpsG family protein [Pseudomonadota bacterium]|nr:EpsG family protein [Pseudomonadota bacterium]